MRKLKTTKNKIYEFYQMRVFA